jgi:hypothetical protein
MGQVIVDDSNKNGLNAIWVLAHACHESGFGSSWFALNRNNFFGIDAIDSNPDQADGYPTPNACIDYYTTWFKNFYMTPGTWVYNGKTPKGANVHYASDPNWANAIVGIMNQFANFINLQESQPAQPIDTFMDDHFKLLMSKVKDVTATVDPITWFNGWGGWMEFRDQYRRIGRLEVISIFNLDSDKPDIDKFRAWITDNLELEYLDFLGVNGYGPVSIIDIPTKLKEIESLKAQVADLSKPVTPKDPVTTMSTSTSWDNFIKALKEILK